MAVTDYSATPSANTAISGINIGENCPRGNVNDAIRQIMADVKSDRDAAHTTQAQGDASTALATTAFVDRFYDIPRTTGGLTRGMCWAISSGFTLVTGAPAGSAYSIYNDSAAAITVTQGSGMTLRLAGTTTTGSRTVAPRAFATIWFNSPTEALIMGNGVT